MTKTKAVTTRTQAGNYDIINITSKITYIK